ncbi:MAG: UDP-N-acetylglucosamine--N-acetylmuramyl-(pentapeptide) pyrophosphoryl-undecaprenol N-acetylglucosamine transferase [Clostridia bacterium]|nr:UDP-N-acetylglucosamine--N-acetylmuramyl-(pentapeptide) pyrophosphoryl-undecaprenol N-acetylglucosamine transferase [Clostridia bacterium]
MRTIVLTGGGTAGHVLPHIALLPYLKKHFDRIVYIGGAGVEKDIVKQNELPYFEITTVKLRRTLTLKNLLIPFKLVKGIREAKKILRELKPTVVFSKGGFVALPVVFAASSLGIKVVAHESDMSLGLANRLTAKKCDTLCTTFPIKQKKYPQMVHTGAILRKSIYTGNAEMINLPKNGKPNLLITGGSLGAAAINNIVWSALNSLCDKWNVLHLTGKGKNNPKYKHPNYLQVEYLENPQNAFAWADVVLARSGSGTVSELLALKKPAIYVPLPRTESRGDQIQNAGFLEKLGVCEVLPQEKLSVDSLMKTLKDVYENRFKYINNCAKQTWIEGTDKVIDYLK